MTDDGWDAVAAWERAGQVPEGFAVNPLWEEARRQVHSARGLRGGVVLDWPTISEGACVACGSWAYTSYRGRSVHMSCAAQLALFVELVGRRQRLSAVISSSSSEQ